MANEAVAEVVKRKRGRPKGSKNKPKAQIKVAAEPSIVKLDLGCGKNKREGFLGVDRLNFEGVDVVLDLGNARWPWEDGVVEEIHASHFVEHLEPGERIHVMNEAYRVLKPGGKMTIIVPHWCSTRAYGDLTHKWPPVSEFWFYYLSAEWRAVNAPHNIDYTCDFDAAWGYSLHPMTQGRGPDFVQFAITAYKEACQDIQATLVKTERKIEK